MCVYMRLLVRQIAYPTLLDVTGFPSPSKNIVGDLSQIDPQPTNSRGMLVVLEVRGGTDKDALDGHRRDSVAICNAAIAQGFKCLPVSAFPLSSLPILC